MRGDKRFATMDSNPLNFNSRPCVRGDLGDFYTFLNTGTLFQFTPLREGRPACVSMVKAFRLIFQFTPLREGRRRRLKKTMMD